MSAQNPTIVTFAASAPPWSLASLDTNFANIANVVNSVNTYSQFLVDSGAVNAYVVTFGAGINVTLTAGLRVAFKAINANTAASTLNVNGTGATAIKNIDGSALVAGQIPLNGIVDVIYDGTQYLLLNIAPVFSTWTPGITFGGSAVGITYSAQNGFYMKNAKFLFAQFNITLSNKGAAPGAVAITGLPVVGSASNSVGGASISYWGNLTGNHICVSALSPGAGTSMAVYGLAAAATSLAALTDADFSNTTQIAGSVVYTAGA